MKTVDKAMKLLNLFSVERGEIGLSEMARMANLDKAATRRLLVALAKHGFIEQNRQTRQYRLGSGFLRLARIREMTTPIGQVSQEITDWLTRETGETAHISVLNADTLTTIAHSEPNRGTIVHLDRSEQLPLNATASGIVFLGFLPAEKRTAILKAPMRAYTADTITSVEEINNLAEQAYRNGFAASENGFEVDVSGIAVPCFGQSGIIEATIAIAVPSVRMNAQKHQKILVLLFEASARVTRAIGGVMHPVIPDLNNS